MDIFCCLYILKQVILLQHIPRYDVDTKDKDKAELARLANKELHKARNASEFAENILVGRHKGLECEGRTRNTRFISDHTNGLHGRNIRMGKMDGIHMYSQAGAEALTKSILSIFQEAGMVKKKRLGSSTSIQGEDQGWTTSQARNRRTNRRNNEVQVPAWEIPTSNRFSDFC